MIRKNKPTNKALDYPRMMGPTTRHGTADGPVHPKLTSAESPSVKLRRYPISSRSAGTTALTMKMLFGLALWQTNEFVECLLRFIGLY